MTATTAGSTEGNWYLADHYYRDVWAHLEAWQRQQLRREYRWLREIGVLPCQAKGVIYRTLLIGKGWDF